MYIILLAVAKCIQLVTIKPVVKDVRFTNTGK